MAVSAGRRPAPELHSHLRSAESCKAIGAFVIEHAVTEHVELAKEIEYEQDPVTRECAVDRDHG